MRLGATMWGDGAPSRSPGRIALIVLEVSIGLIAPGGGVLLMTHPDGSLPAIAPAALSALKHNRPFPDFLILGLAPAVVALLVRHRLASTWS